MEEVSERPLAGSHDLPKDLLLAQVHLYDQRGGGVETSFKGDWQGMALGTRNKKRFEAQQMVMLLENLAHNVLQWAQTWLATRSSAVQHYGPVRLIRDVFHMSGFLLLDAWGHIRQIGLNRDAPLAPVLLSPFQTWLAPAHVAIYLAQTEMAFRAQRLPGLTGSLELHLGGDQAASLGVRHSRAMCA